LSGTRREVSTRLELDVLDEARLVWQIAVGAGTTGDDRRLVETLDARLDGVKLVPRELSTSHRGRVHVLESARGRLVVEYAATVVGRDAPQTSDEAELLEYLRPSRYAESDLLAAVAVAEFAGLDGPGLLAGVSSWVGGRLEYVPGSSRPVDGAVATLLAGQGVCRDFAHLVVALLRAMDVPARVAAVYAPGLSPMDFHAVAEAHVGGAWYVVDSTLLAPRATMLRISTGRDAADTAFLSVYGGTVNLLQNDVMATVGGDLPGDDLHRLRMLT
jgi:transglutaminase-like putative cysteine protease